MRGLHEGAFLGRGEAARRVNDAYECAGRMARPAVWCARALDGHAASAATAHTGAGGPAQERRFGHGRAPGTSEACGSPPWPAASPSSASIASTVVPKMKAAARIAPTTRGFGP